MVDNQINLVSSHIVPTSSRPWSLAGKVFTHKNTQLTRAFLPWPLWASKQRQMVHNQLGFYGVKNAWGLLTKKTPTHRSVPPLGRFVRADTRAELTSWTRRSFYETAEGTKTGTHVGGKHPSKRHLGGNVVSSRTTTSVNLVVRIHRGESCYSQNVAWLPSKDHHQPLVKWKALWFNRQRT